MILQSRESCFFLVKSGYYLIVIVGTILPFLQILTGVHSNLETTPLADALQSVQSKVSAAFSVALCLPLIVDLLIDGVQYILNTNASNKSHNNDSTKNSMGVDVVDRIEVMMVIAGNLIQHLIMLFPMHGYRNIALLYCCARRSCSVLIIGSICHSLHRYNKDDNPYQTSNNRIFDLSGIYYYYRKNNKMTR